MKLPFETEHSWAITGVRVALGVLFFAHGSQKVLGWFGGYGLEGTTGSFVSTGIPRPIAYAGCFFELNWELTPGRGHGFEANLAFLTMAVACAIAGGDVPNRGDLDRLFAHIQREKRRLDIVFANADAATYTPSARSRRSTITRGIRRIGRAAHGDAFQQCAARQAR